MNLTDDQVKHILIKPISEDIINSQLEKIVERMKKEDENQIQNKNKMVYISSNLYKMFHLETGGGIRKYRKYLVNKLCAFGEIGERIWREIISDTSSMEHLNSEGIKYPWTLEEANKMYN